MEHSAEVRELRQCMDAFLEERCAEKLKGSGDEAERAKVKARFQREAWLADAAEKALKIQIVTHCIKYTHSGIKKEDASEIYDDKLSSIPKGFIGTHLR